MYNITIGGRNFQMLNLPRLVIDRRKRLYYNRVNAGMAELVDA